MTLVASPAQDTVSEALRSLGVRSTVFCLSELQAPWAFRVDGSAVAKFHLVLEGSGVVLCDGEQPVAVAAGDLVVLPRGAAHTIADVHDTHAISLEQLLAEHPVDGEAQLRYGGTGPATRLLCGGFALTEGLPEPVLGLFPEVLHVDGSTVAATTWLEPALAALNSEAEDGQPGAAAILAKIADVFLAQALRVWLVGAERAGVLVTGLLHDQPIGKAVHALRSRPTEMWTLDRLAMHVGLSRTALATRFRQLVGESPMRYLAKVRLSQAAGYLSTSQLTLYEIAHLTGYDNDAALSKAFKREFGQAPGAYRASARRPPVIEIANAS